MINLCPEYREVEKLLFAFRHPFFNTRFGFGRTMAEISHVLQGVVEIEIFCPESDRPMLMEDLARFGLNRGGVQVTSPCPLECHLNSFMPIFGRVDGDLYGLTFPYLPNHENYATVHSKCEAFARDFLAGRGISEVRMPFPFATAKMSMNATIALICSAHAADLPWFEEHLVQISFAVPYIETENTKDLDIFVLPVADDTWLVSRFADDRPEQRTIDAVVEVLRRANQQVIDLPGLEVVRHDDVKCLPNYANTLLVNGVAIVPQFDRPEDEVALGILGDLGYDTYGIDARKIVESNSIFHCMSKTVPARAQPST